MSLEITFGSLWTHASLPSEARASLAQLSDENTHVHGLLSIIVDGKVLPRLGFLGPDDVCFNAWVHELAAASRTLLASDPATYVYDEGEQGQPAFHFERSGSQVFASVRTSPISDCPGDPTCERIPYMLDEFAIAVSRFLVEFRQTLVAEAGHQRAQRWWDQFADPA